MTPLFDSLLEDEVEGLGETMSNSSSGKPGGSVKSIR